MPASSLNDMPDIEIVDLENDDMQDTDSGNFQAGHRENLYNDLDDTDSFPENDEVLGNAEEIEDENPAPAGIRRFLNPHILFAVVLVVVIGIVGYRVTHWGQRISQSEIFKDGRALTMTVGIPFSL